MAVFMRTTLLSPAGVNFPGWSEGQSKVATPVAVAHWPQRSQEEGLQISLLLKCARADPLWPQPLCLTLSSISESPTDPEAKTSQGTPQPSISVTPQPTLLPALPTSSPATAISHLEDSCHLNVYLLNVTF